MKTSQDRIAKNQSSHTVTLCSVCIATYKRPHLLEKTLKSLENQHLPDNVAAEIIVVDNDVHKSAESVVREFQQKLQTRCLYFNQPEKNISLTRNLGVKKASGDYILFIDDDEVACPEWIYHLLRTTREFKADGAFGPVVPEFSSAAPQWMRRADLFYAPVPASGTKASHKFTSNCIVSAKIIKKMKNPFDIRYGLTGGEDTHLFDRLEQQGAHFVYCKESWVSEYLPPSRTRTFYIFLRSMRGGNSHTRRTIEFAGPKEIWIRLFMLFKSVILGSVSLILVLVFLINPLHRTRWLIKLASNIGRFFAVFGQHYRGYR